MKQKIVMKVPIKDAKSRCKAMKTAVGMPGVISATLDDSKDHLVVVGEGIDSVKLTTALRKKMGFADIISVEDNEKKKEEEKNPTIVWPTSWAYQYGVPPPPHHVYQDPYQYNCCIM
ncbi:disease resistance protein Pik-1-like [Magnolia sinica]|uniref:disease resistance protein Pik-1-like n=1 Tax=Magnolia sinica TaxID=86752 RepID=UPI002659400C|nr:disease resistance protein Pik-1-like [Magnolia sinica]